MSEKSNIRTCRYINCPYDHKIDLQQDEYKLVGKAMYYHAECLQKKRKGEWKDEQTKKDLQYIKNKWVECIDKTVIYWQLMQCLNELIQQGISSEYLVFTIDYVVEHKMSLHYPKGFKYFVAKAEIKNAYEKQQISKKNIPKINEFTAEDDTETPTFTLKQRNNGFGRILKGHNNGN